MALDYVEYLCYICEMRRDLEALKVFIVWDETIQKYGEPLNNKSVVIYKCDGCHSFFEATIRQIKGRLKSLPPYLCRSCSAKTASIKIWSNPEYKSKHLNGCLNSYTSERRAKIAESSKKHWQDPTYRENQVKMKKELWQQEKYQSNQAAYKTNEFRTAQSERQIHVASDSFYRENASTRQKSVWQDEEYRKNQSNKQKKVWDSPGYRGKASEKQREIWLRSGYKDKYIEIWKNPEYRSLLSEKIKSVWMSEDFRSRASERSKARWEDPEYREKIVSGISRRWLDPVYRKLRSDQARKMWQDESYREKAGLLRAAQSGKPSSIEVVAASILSGLDLDYETQKPVGHYVFDFWIPSEDVYIECQGEYWHSREGIASKDAAKATYLESARPGSRLLYILEREFMNPNAVIAKICSFISNDKTGIIIDDFDFKSVIIRQVTKKEALTILSSYHYAGYGRSAKFLFGAFVQDKLAAICKFSTIIRAEVATSMGMQPQEVLELDRFCIHPKFQKHNFASWFLSRTIKSIFIAASSVKRLVSFSDTTYGHSGGIYKAANWKVVGIVDPDYCYIGTDGFFIHKKTLYNRAVRMGMKEAEYASLHSYEKSFGREKVKFRFDRSPSLGKTPLDR